MLFITSSVDGPARRAGGDAGRSRSSRAAGEKCPRCWRFVTDAGTDGDLAGLCALRRRGRRRCCCHPLTTPRRSGGAARPAPCRRPLAPAPRPSARIQPVLVAHARRRRRRSDHQGLVRAMLPLVREHHGHSRARRLRARAQRGRGVRAAQRRSTCRYKWIAHDGAGRGWRSPASRTTRATSGTKSGSRASASR